jgi:hypothetical protein
MDLLTKKNHFDGSLDCGLIAAIFNLIKFYKAFANLKQFHALC